MELSIKDKRFIELSYILDFDNYRDSLKSWLKLSRPTQEIQHWYSIYFDKYLPVVKPLIHRYHHSFIFLNPISNIFVTFLNESQIERLRIIYNLEKFQIYTQQRFQTLKSQLNVSLISPQEFKTLIDHPYMKIQRIKLQTDPQNAQVNFWHTHIQVERIEIKGKVIKGKGIGEKQLGMPTANLEIVEEIKDKLKLYPSGIYFAEFQFMQSSDSLKYYGMVSVGTNPQYQNFQTCRVIEVYVYHNFEDQLFYDAKVKICLLTLIRFEGKFQNNDCFLNAMHNDIFFGKSLIKKIK